MMLVAHCKAFEEQCGTYRRVTRVSILVATLLASIVYCPRRRLNL